uniref:Malate dehydrogenase 2, NAD (mitochondrial) n=1 Tax=Mus musculus TaxID=10090 RepID=J3QMC8_MOUSE
MLSALARPAGAALRRSFSTSAQATLDRSSCQIASKVVMWWSSQPECPGNQE